jgi:hypothetical protein
MRLTTFTGGKKRGSGGVGAKVDQRTTVPGFVNGNRQEVMARMGFGSASFPGQTGLSDKVQEDAVRGVSRGVWSEWMRYTCAAVSAVPAGKGG